MTPQSNIAHYKITGKLGAGGMGEVYRATDTKLGREVAIKVIPDAFAQDADRMARFGREAQVLASLNHPNIAAIYGVEERALVLELVEGPTLGERIAQGAIPSAEALPIIQQLIDALEYAHEKGIVHRDLKPANLKITPEGRLKVLDFGLARAFANDSAAGDPMSSPTLTMRATLAGAIMGTAGYMSPEQARGHNADKRADIWAFGAVVYEMLTGEQLFGGATISDSLAAVLTRHPDLDRVPPEFRKLVRLCLVKDVKQRLRDIGDARILLADAPAPPPVIAARPGIPVWAAAILGVALLALGGSLWRATRPVARPMMRFSADLGPEAVRGQRVTAVISPDGARLVFPVHGAGATTLLATRLLDQSKANVLAGTEGATDPFFSPDGQWIAFFADQSMKKISVMGGAPMTLCPTSGAPRGGAWGEDDFIIANLDNSHLFRVPAAGGQAVIVGKPEDHRERTWRWPQILPGGQRVLFTGGNGSAVGAGYEDANAEVLSLKTGQVTILQHGGYFARYLPSGHLTYIHQGTMFAAPFDLASLQLRGIPAPVLEDVAATVGQGAGQLDFAQNGTLVYLSGKTTTGVASLVWMDPSGKTQPLMTTSAVAVTPRLSPDGKRMVVSIAGDIAIYDIDRSATTPLTFNPQQNRNPVWMPDGKHIVFSELGAGAAIWWIRSDGSGQPRKLLGGTISTRVSSVSPDGRTLAYYDQSGDTGLDLWTLPLDLSDPDAPKPGKPESFLREPSDQVEPAFSPDGRWIAYTSLEARGPQVFVRPFPNSAAGGKWQISTADGRFPVWSRGSKELLYLAGDNLVMAVNYIVKGDGFVPDKPRPWSPVAIQRNGTTWNFDLSPDGKRLVVFPLAATQEGADKASVHVTVLLNFFDELRRRMPSGGKSI